MSKLLFCAACFLLLLCSCTEKRNTSYFWVRFDDDTGKADTNWILRLDTLNDASTIQISYLASKDSISYSIKPTRTTGSTIDWWDGKDPLVQHSDTTVTIDSKPYEVIRYLSKKEIDGSTLHYWTPEVGVFVIHSNTWPIISVLQSSDTTLNSKIKKLVRATVPAHFIRGKLLMELRD